MTSIFDFVPPDLRLITIITTIIAITVLLNWFVNSLIRRMTKTRLLSGAIDITLLNFLHRLISFLIYSVGIASCLTYIPELKIVGHSILAGAGILTVVGGLASQQVLGNIVSGFMIILFHPFKIGDRVKISDSYTGTVEDITLRETIIRDFENNRIIVPNSQMSSQVLINFNHTDSKICKFIEVGVGYSTNLESAMAIMQDEITKHPLVIDHRTEDEKLQGVPVVIVRVTALGDSSITLKAWVWADNPSDGFVLQCDCYANVKRRFDEEKIEIPFPQRTISFAEETKDIVPNLKDN
jgi:small-conductance mechanosensitive channel